MSPIAKAAFWMTGAIASFSAMAVAGREVSATHDTFEIMMYRSLVGLVVVGMVLTALKRWGDVRRDRLSVHVMRNAAHFTGQNLWFFAVTVAPLAQVFALEFTSPLWVIGLSPLLLGERITSARALAALLGFVGILVVARPDAVGLTPGVISAASSAVFFALTIILTKRLTRHEPITSILFWLTAIQAVFGIATAGWDGDIAAPTADTWLWLLLIGMAGLLAHFCMTRALALAPATVVVPFDFARLPTIAVVGMILYDEIPTIWVLIGAILILLGNYINISAESRPDRTTPPLHK